MPKSPSVARSRKQLAQALSLVLYVALLAYLSIAQLQPPPAVASDAPPDQFSSARARRHLQAITQKPHPTGTQEHARVRRYILDELAAHGLAPEVQETIATASDGSDARPGGARPVAVARVANVVARLKGTQNTKALLLVAHYDSVPTAPGATDDGAGVSALLETLRALRAQPPLKNDVVFLFTDAEELGLLGARAFVAEHPLMKDVGLVMNFEGRGARGPVMMFETSEGNGWLIREFARAAPHPVANSLMYAAYKLLPNDTDLTVFKRAGLPALNFAYTDGVTHYHTALDTADAADERSLQHHGSYALALARHFGHLDLHAPREDLKARREEAGDRREETDARRAEAHGEAGGEARAGRAPDAVYFNLFGSMFVHYSLAWATFVSLLVALVFAVVVAYGFRTRQLNARALAAGFLSVPCVVVLCVALLTLVWLAIRAAHADFDTLPWGDPYNADLYKLAFVALALASTSALFRLVLRKVSRANLAAGACAWWLVLLVAATLALPTGSFLFAWPLLSSLAGLAFVLATKKPDSATREQTTRDEEAMRRQVSRDEQSASDMNAATWACVVVLALAAAPAVLLGAPLVYMMLMLFGVSFASWASAFVVLLLSLLVPQLDFVTTRTRWLLPAASALVGASLVVAGLTTAGANSRQPKIDSLFYALDADEGRALWGTFDRATDEWTSQFIPPDSRRESLGAFFPWISRAGLHSATDAAPLVAPTLEVLQDETRGDVRVLRARIRSAREAALVLVFVDPSTPVLSAVVDGRNLAGNVERATPHPATQQQTRMQQTTQQQTPAAPSQTPSNTSSPSSAASSSVMSSPSSSVASPQTRDAAAPSASAPSQTADSWKLLYAAPPHAGFELTLEVRQASQPLKIFVEDVSYGLPQLPAQIRRPRPAHTMPAPQFLTSETAIVRRTFVVEKP